MNVARRLLYSTVAFLGLTGAAVFTFPSINFVQYTGQVLGLGTASLLVLTAVAFYRDGDLTLRDKNLLMNGFLIAVLVPSFYTAGAFVHQSQTSWSGGEVHWHADYEVVVSGDRADFGFDPSEEYSPSSGQFCKAAEDQYLCEVELVDPEDYCDGNTGDPLCAVSDRTGETRYHEHDDGRIHLEGIFKNRKDATLSAFFETFGGELSTTDLAFPTNHGWVNRTEEENQSLKVIVKRGVLRDRGWCALSNKVPENMTCKTWTGEYAYGPSEYVISRYKKNKPTNNVLLDDIFVIYDNRTTEEAIRDLKEDQKYRGFEMYKRGG